MIKILTILAMLASQSIWAHPLCNIESNHSESSVGLLSGSASGFQAGRINITLSNGTRKYTTQCDQDGKWALSYADVETRTDVLCWQEGNPQQAQASFSR